MSSHPHHQYNVKSFEHLLEKWYINVLLYNVKCFASWKSTIKIHLMFFNRDGEGESTSPSHHTGSLKRCSTLEDSKKRAEGWNVSRREGGHQEDSCPEVQRPRNMEGLLRYVMLC